jgi:hypothetical protein
VACLRARPELPALAYLDLPYGMAYGDVARGTIDSLRAAGVGLGDPVGGEDGPAKARAAGCYRSQLPLLARVFGARLHASLDTRAERLLAVEWSDRSAST